MPRNNIGFRLEFKTNKVAEKQTYKAGEKKSRK